MHPTKTLLGCPICAGTFKLSLHRLEMDENYVSIPISSFQNAPDGVVREEESLRALTHRRKPPPAAARLASSSPLAASLVSPKPASTPSMSAAVPRSTLPPSSYTSPLATIANGGVMPNIHAHLLPKTAGTRCCFFQGR
ncbi:hypothetical protein RHMOL_Rhmol06G0032900 [Rhododendron molle]|uniref:Uncharacterized protein n=1 Tax=Rhododendron molle TaxID=49168 RepID=A0ACC0N9H1_RHOML|nr:hypothetical protein RHMOL_Rhmol06G0032900 [Rhododendron molle]